MKIRITQDKDGTRPELRAHDVNEVVPPGQTAEARIRRYLADQAANLGKHSSPLDVIAVELTDDAGTPWQWKGWGHEMLIRSQHQLNRMDPRDSMTGGFRQTSGD